MVAGKHLWLAGRRFRGAGVSVCHTPVEDADCRVPAKHGGTAKHGHRRHGGVGRVFQLLCHIPARAGRQEKHLVERLRCGWVSQPADVARAVLLPDGASVSDDGCAVHCDVLRAGRRGAGGAAPAVATYRVGLCPNRTCASRCISWSASSSAYWGLLSTENGPHW